MNQPTRKEFQIHSKEWACDAIRRDPDLSECPKVRACVENVIMNTLWRKQDGWKSSDTVPTDETSFLVNSPLDYDIPTTTVKRGVIIQPQATGQQNKRKIGSGTASSHDAPDYIYKQEFRFDLSYPPPTEPVQFGRG
jgi:hypothetical protein